MYFHRVELVARFEKSVELKDIKKKFQISLGLKMFNCNYYLALPREEMNFLI